jgi:hypothetical protein
MHICHEKLRPKEIAQIKIHSNECLHNDCMDCKCKNIEIVKTVKYLQLGIHLDDQFNWKFHIRHLTIKMRQIIKEVRMAKNKLTAEALRIVYFSLAHSHLIYGITAWGFGNLNPLIILQEKLLNVMSRKSQVKPDKSIYQVWSILPLKATFERILLTTKYFEVQARGAQNALT